MDWVGMLVMSGNAVVAVGAALAGGYVLYFLWWAVGYRRMMHRLVRGYSSCLSHIRAGNLRRIGNSLSEEAMESRPLIEVMS